MPWVKAHAPAGTTPTGTRRGRTRLRAPIAVAGKRRRRRPGLPRRADGAASGGGAGGIGRGPRHAPPWSHCPVSTERRGPLLPAPQAMGRDRGPAVWLHMQGSVPGVRRGRRRPAGRAGKLARDCGRTRGRGKETRSPNHMGCDVTPIHAGDTHPLPWLTWVQYRQAAVAGLVYLLLHVVAATLGARCRRLTKQPCPACWAADAPAGVPGSGRACAYREGADARCQGPHRDGQRRARGSGA